MIPQFAKARRPPASRKIASITRITALGNSYTTPGGSLHENDRI